MKNVAFLLPVLLSLSGPIKAAPPVLSPGPKAGGAVVEKDGVVFEIVVPQREWAVPEAKDRTAGPKLDLKLRITNKTGEPLRFNAYDTALPELLTPEGKPVHRWEGDEANSIHIPATEADYPLVMPGKSVTLPLQADLFRIIMGNQPMLMFRWYYTSGACRWPTTVTPARSPSTTTSSTSWTTSGCWGRTST